MFELGYIKDEMAFHMNIRVNSDTENVYRVSITIFIKYGQQMFYQITNYRITEYSVISLINIIAIQG